MNEYTYAWSQYAVFSGRATKKEYWMFFLVNLIISVILSILAQVSDLVAILSLLYNLAVFLPSLAVGVRRMHDAGHSGWWMLAPLINLFFLCESTDRSSRYV